MNDPNDMNDMTRMNAEIDAGQRARLAEIADEIRRVIERLDEAQFDILREASARKTGRPAVDRILTQARRALEKAAHLIED
ncbi:MAG: hypothetical protein ACKOHN_02985 [Actinomycetota bacterium]